MSYNYNCDLCDYHTDNRDLFYDHEHTKRHNRIKNGETEYRCGHKLRCGGFCKYRTFGKNYYDKHIKMHEPLNIPIRTEKLYSCDKCRYNTTRLDNYNRHMKSPAHNRMLKEGYKYKCEICNFNTNDRSHFVNHELTKKHINNIKDAEHKKMLAEKEAKNPYGPGKPDIVCECGESYRPNKFSEGIHITSSELHKKYTESKTII